jgi:hypothetical protein
LRKHTLLIGGEFHLPDFQMEYDQQANPHKLLTAEHHQARGWFIKKYAFLVATEAILATTYASYDGYMIGGLVMLGLLLLLFLQALVAAGFALASRKRYHKVSWAGVGFAIVLVPIFVSVIAWAVADSYVHS